MAPSESTDAGELATSSLPSSTCDPAQLGTAQIRLQDSRAISQPVRALCDNGSQLNLITKDCVQRCGLHYKRECNILSGVGSYNPLNSSGYVDVLLHHRQDDIVPIEIRLFVVAKISSRLPQISFERQFETELTEEKLADPAYNIPGQIDTLLGAGIWAAITIDGIIKKQSGRLSVLAQNTSLGWVIIGHFGEHVVSRPISLHIRAADRTDELLERFWEVESVPMVHTRSSDEEWVEANFVRTHSRDSSGRYIVTIPIRENAPVLGNSYGVALKRYYALERRVAKEPELNAAYQEFMQDYLKSGHMIPAPPATAESILYYIPYHIIKKKKKRVVFDASCATSTGVSFNDIQLPGEKLQADLGKILLRFRLHRYAIAADITQMFRQILVDQSQHNYQRILWRPSPNEPVKEYCLTTVTWGMTSAGFNAVRALRQCAIDEADKFPAASQAALNDFYIDDFLSGRNDYHSLVQLHDQMIQMLRLGGFELAKWATNNEQLANELRLDSSSEITLQTESGILGMAWLPSLDTLKLKIKVHDISNDKRLTKRDIVSRVSEVYDPSGMCGSVLVLGKILIQDLWKVKDLRWDDPAPIDIVNRWKAYHATVMELSSQCIPRWVGADTEQNMQLHIFCDASEVAYGAVVYLRTHNSDGTITSRLLTSKSRVAPIAKVSIPRLELLAAHLGATLAEYVVNACMLREIPIYFWSDSTIVIHWLKKDPASLKQFVANRVSSIIKITKSMKGNWHHVPGTENPADLLSRGISSAKELMHSTLWWNGPIWLQLAQSEWHQPAVTMLTSEELETEKRESKPAVIGLIKLDTTNCFCVEGPNGNQEPLVNRRSTLDSILRVTSFVIRFINVLKRKVKEAKDASGRSTVSTRNIVLSSKDVSTPTPDERNEALLYWIGIAQKCYYSQEIRAFKKKVELPTNSPLRNFAPFVDERGLIHVGGRLENMEAGYEHKHQIFVPPESTIGKLLIRNAHLRTLHGGNSVTKAFLRQRFWFLRIGMAVRSVTHRCPTCIRYRKQPGEQLMGQLPAVRVNMAEPFSRVGVDFAGPFKLRKTTGKLLPIRQAALVPYREPPTVKGWIVVYVCLVTRAVHLDVVQGLTVEDFLETFAKMTSRRGMCKEIWSDNGTTFVGANNEMKRVLEEWHNEIPAERLASYGTTWHFITPAAPFQGGIWEAGVKSVKHHLTRGVGKRLLTPSQLYTIVTQIEGVLNSRPLWPQSDDPLDLSPITPAHLVIGRSTLQRPLTENVSERADNRLTIWGLQQKMQHSFWKRWKEEYLNNLQRRGKWYKPKENLKIGDMVIIMAENGPPTSWPLGRVLEVRKGQDGYVRSALIRTEKSKLERPIQKLCVLPSATQQPPINSST